MHATNLQSYPYRFVSISPASNMESLSGLQGRIYCSAACGHGLTSSNINKVVPVPVDMKPSCHLQQDFFFSSATRIHK